VIRLPETLRPFAAAIGEDNALLLAWKCGGQRWRLKRGVAHPAARSVLGRECALKLSERFHNQQISIPIANGVLAHWLRSTRGLTPMQIASELRITYARVTQLLRPASKV